MQPMNSIPRKKHDDVTMSPQDYLPNAFSKNLESADDEAKVLALVMHRIEMEEYQRQYDNSCIVFRQEAKDEEHEQLAQNGVEETTEKVCANCDKEPNVKGNEMNSNIINDEKQTSLMQESNGSIGLVKRITEPNIGTDVQVRKRPKWPYELCHINHSSSMERKTVAADARSHTADHSIKHSMQNGNHPALQLKQGRIFNPPTMVNPSTAFQTYAAASGRKPIPTTPQAPENAPINDVSRKRYFREDVNDAYVPLHPALPGNVSYTSLIEQYINKGNVVLDKYYSQSYPSVCHGTRTVTQVDNGAHSTVSLGPSPTGTGSSHGSADLSNSLSGISKPNHQDLPVRKQNDAIKQVQDEMHLTYKEVLLLLQRGAKSIADDAARALNGEVAKPCEEASIAAIKFLKGQDNDCPISTDDTRKQHSLDPRSDGTRCNTSTQLEKLSDEVRSNIATVAAAATAVGLRLLPPCEANNQCSNGKLSVGQHDSASIVQPNNLEAFPTRSDRPISLPPPKEKNLDCTEEVSVGQNGNASTYQLKNVEALSTWTAHDILHNSIRLESTRVRNSALQLRESLLHDAMEIQQLQNAMEAKYRAFAETDVAEAAQGPVLSPTRPDHVKSGGEHGQ